MTPVMTMMTTKMMMMMNLALFVRDSGVYQMNYRE